MTKLAIQEGNPVRDTPLRLAEPIIGEEEKSAITKVLRLKRIREGDVVIVPSYTHLSSVNAVLYVGKLNETFLEDYL